MQSRDEQNNPPKLELLKLKTFDSEKLAADIAKISDELTIKLQEIVEKPMREAQQRRAAYITYNSAKIPRNETSQLNRLPQALVLQILGLLTAVDLCRASTTCHELNDLIKLNAVWTKRLIEDFGYTPHEVNPRSTICYSLDDKPHKEIYQDKKRLHGLMFQKPQIQLNTLLKQTSPHQAEILTNAMVRACTANINIIDPELPTKFWFPNK